MARVRDFPQADALVGTEKLYADDGTTDRHSTVDQIAEFVDVVSRVRDSTTTTGTGTLTLANSPPSGYVTFASHYLPEAPIRSVKIVDLATGDWEVGNYTLDSVNLVSWDTGDFISADIYPDESGFNNITSLTGQPSFDASLTATALIESAGSGERRLGNFESLTRFYEFGDTITASMYAKPGLRDRIFWTWIDNDSPSNTLRQAYILSGAGSTYTETSDATNAAVFISATITNVGSGWYRITLTGTPNTDQFVEQGVSNYIYLLDSLGAFTYTGNTSGVAMTLAGLQVEVGASATTFVGTPNQLIRDADNLWASSNNDALVSFGAGSKQVFQVLADPYKNAAASVVNILSYGARGDGVTDDTAAFEAFAADYQGASVKLIMPPGNYYVDSSSIFQGIKRLHIEGYGAVFVENSGGQMSLALHYMSASNDIFDGTVSSKIDSAAPGDTTITLQVAADVANYTYNDWIYIYGMDIYGINSNPPSPYYFEFHEVVNFDLGLGTLTLRSPLENYYLDTWPIRSDGLTVFDPADNDQGGPGTVVNLSKDGPFDTELIVEGVEFRLYMGNTLARRVHFLNCKFFADAGIDSCGASMTHNFRFEGCVWAGNNDRIEPDKGIYNLEFIDCDRLPNIVVQSPNNRLLIDGCNWAGASFDDGLDGTFRFTTIRNSSIPKLSLGPQGYGHAESVVIENCNIRWMTTNGNANFTALGVNDFTIANGVVTGDYAVIDNQPGWAQPGGVCFFTNVSNGLGSPNAPFRILRMDQPRPGVVAGVPEPVSIYTTLPEPFPVYTGSSGADALNDYFLPHPCPRLTVRNSTGCSSIQDYSSGPDGIPYGSYTRFLFHTAVAANPNSGNEMGQTFGHIKQITINVKRAHTGAGGTVTFTMAAAYVKTDTLVYQSSTTVFTVDLKTAGKRIITPGQNYGIQLLDSIPIFDDTWWFTSKWNPSVTSMASDDLNECPIWEVEILMGHGPEVDALNFSNSETLLISS